jgi:hypothetical protein
VHIIALIPAVTEPPKIVPYYRLSLSTWPLSNNKELFCRLRRVKPGKSHTTGSLICAKPTRWRDQSTTLHYITLKSTSLTLLQTRFFVRKSKHDQSLNSGNKTSAWYTREAIHAYHSSASFSHSSSQPSRIEPGHGITWKPQIKKSWVLILSKTYPIKENTTRHARLFGCWVCFAKSD